MQSMTLYKFPNTSRQHTHPNPKFLCFGRAGNHIAVIVGKNNQWFSLQLRLKYLLAGGVKIVTVNQGNHSFFKVQQTTPQTEKSISSVIVIGG